LIGITTDRGFTSHEHLDELNLIHMNGRVYDPVLGRFMTADPFIQAPGNLQSYNRYSYVFNNPLAYTDPSGYFSLSKALKKLFKNRTFRTLVGIGVAIFAPEISGFLGWTGGYIATSTSTIAITGGLSASLGLSGAVASGMLGGALAGAIIGGDLRSAVAGGISGGILGGINGYFGNEWSLGRVAANSFAGGIDAELNGGRFADGFRNSFLSSALRAGMDSFSGYMSDWSTSTGEAVIKPAASYAGEYLSKIGDPDVLRKMADNTGLAVTAIDMDTCLLVCGMTVTNAIRELGGGEIASQYLHGISGSASLFSEYGPLSYLSRYLPGFRASSVFHDRFVGITLRALGIGDGTVGGVLTVMSIPPAFAAQYYALDIGRYDRIKKR
jgi:RHS repeat-associated protein